MARITITALDTLFFRDGKPFSKGEETWADSTFPPPPSVLYGAISTWYIEQKKGSDAATPFDLLVEESKKIEIKHIFLEIEHKGVYVPLPLDLMLAEEKNKELTVTKMRPIAKPISHLDGLLFNNLPIESVLTPDEKLSSKPVTNGLIAIEDITNYQKIEKPDTLRLMPLIKSEPKVGISISKKLQSAADGNLYRVDLKRPLGVSIVLEVEFPDFPFPPSSEHIIKLGGEGRFANMSLDHNPEPISIKPPTIQSDGFFKLYLSTPAFFKDGWKPDLIPFGFSKETRLIAAAVGRPLHIGGFDMRYQKPKPMRRAVPAGSVYYFQTPSPEAITNIHGNTICSTKVDCNQGFGIAYVSAL